VPGRRAAGARVAQGVWPGPHGQQCTILIHDGELIQNNLRRERLTRNDLEEEARKQQLSSLDQIRWAILEDDGAISIIPKP
jgi:uncharacterized membrane protein YcaP (DUF421 family)